MPLNYKPKVGQYLYASCSAGDFGRILAVGVDQNNEPTIDIEVYDINEIIWCDGSKFPKYNLTRFVIEPDNQPFRTILEDVQWKFVDFCDNEPRIVCNTPGNNCYRCTKLFWVRDERSS